MSKVLTSSNKFLMSGGRWLTRDSSGPSLPPYTIRLRYMDGVTPTFNRGTAVQVSSSPNIWDLTYEHYKWNALLYQHATLLEVIEANTTGVSNMTDLFSDCYSLTSVPLFDTSSVTNMSYMFRYCYFLTSVPLFDTSSVTSMQGTFQSCQTLTTVPLFDTSSVTDMTQMFASCSRLTSVPLFDTSSVTTMQEMFFDCSSLTSIPLFNTSSVTDMFGMFYMCSNVENGALALYQQASSQAIVPDHSRTFYNCGAKTVTGAAELAQIPDDWKNQL